MGKRSEQIVQKIRYLKVCGKKSQHHHPSGKFNSKPQGEAETQHCGRVPVQSSMAPATHRKVHRHHPLQLDQLLKRQKIVNVGEEVEQWNVCITLGKNVKELKESLWTTVQKFLRKFKREYIYAGVYIQRYSQNVDKGSHSHVCKSTGYNIQNREPPKRL